MPIPNFSEERPQESQRMALQLVPSIGARKPKAYFYPRAVAHCLDLFVVQGFSLYASKFATLALLSGHMEAIQDTGRLAGGIFREALNFGNSQVFVACFGLFTLIYFVGMPHVFGRTLGLGIFGLKLENEQGGRPDFGALTVRLATYVFSWVSLGLVFAVGLRRRDGRFLHDQWSGTRITKA